MEYGEERGGMTGTELKLLAMASMALDHGAYVLLYPLTAGDEALYGFYLALRAAGRLAFPIYAFLLVQGFLHTSGKGRYLARLWAFALISEIPFDLAIAGELVYPGAQNVFVTLAAGMGTLWAMERWGRDRLFPSVLMALAGGIGGGAFAGGLRAAGGSPAGGDLPVPPGSGGPDDGGAGGSGHAPAGALGYPLPPCGAPHGEI